MTWVCDGSDVVDAGHGEDVEDDVGAGDEEHREEVEEEAGEPVRDPARALHTQMSHSALSGQFYLSITDGQARDEAAGVRDEYL